MDKIEGNGISVRFANEGEKFQAIGERNALSCQPGVICYVDANGVICYGWNYRDAARTCLNERTRRAIFFADSATAATRRQAENAIRDLSKALGTNENVVVSQFVLDKQTSELSF